MKLVAISDITGPAETAGITFEHEDGAAVAWFTIPKIGTTPSITVDVRADGSNLKFFPERSAGQRQILKRLGIQL